MFNEKLGVSIHFEKQEYGYDIMMEGMVIGNVHKRQDDPEYWDGMPIYKSWGVGATNFNDCVKELLDQFVDDYNNNTLPQRQRKGYESLLGR